MNEGRFTFDVNLEAVASNVTFLKDARQQEAEAVVKRTLDELKKAGASGEGEVIRALHGTVAQALIDSAREQKADTIVVGSRGLTDLAGLVLGSVAHKVIHLSDKPVVVAR